MGDAAPFLVIGGGNALLGLIFLFNVRNAGVRYVQWYRKHWAWTRGVPAWHGPRATRTIAGIWGAFLIVWDGGIAAFFLYAVLK